MKKITFIVALFLMNIAFCQTTHNLNWQIGVNGASASLTIDVGDTVVWTWTDAVNHSVTSKPGSQENFDSGFQSGMGSTFSYTFTQVGTNDYQCDVHPGSMFGTITVVNSAPTCDDPSNLMSINVTNSSADVSWTENGTATEWEIEYGLAGFNQGNGTVVLDDDGVGSETLNSLSGSNTYDFYVRAICTNSNSNWVGPEQFTTEPDPCMDPSDLSVSNITTTTADISWTENGNATEWEIEYGEAGFTPGAGNTVLDNDGNLGETLTTLDPETAYDFYVRSICTENESLWIGPSTFTTMQLGVANETFTNFTYYPNPVESEISLKSDISIQEISLYNILGQKLLEKSVNKTDFTMSMANLDSGLYLLKVNINGNFKTYSILKK